MQCLVVVVCCADLCMKAAAASCQAVVEELVRLVSTDKKPYKLEHLG